MRTSSIPKRGSRVPTSGSPRSHFGQLPPNVVEKLYSRLHVTDDNNASADLARDTWTVKVGFINPALWTASYDGTGLREVSPGGSDEQTVPAPPQSPVVTTGQASSPSTPVPTGPAPNASAAQKLLNCVRRADQNVQKLEACQRRYTP